MMIKKNKYNFSKKVSKNNPFVVPEGYFDNFSERLMGKIEQEELEVKRPVYKTKRFLRPVLSMAASFVIIFMLIYFPAKLLKPKIETENNNNSSELFYLLGLYHINDLAVLDAFDRPAEDQYDEQFLENILIASMTEYDLIHLNE